MGLKMDGACFVWVVISPLFMFIENRKKKDIVHDVFSGHNNDVHLWNVYQIKKENNEINP